MEMAEAADIFQRATEFVRSISGNLGSSDLLYLYARYKQAIEGPCNIPRPGFFDFQGKQKWDAWKSLDNMSKEDAMNEYILHLTSIHPSWDEQLKQGTVKKTVGMGTAVSTLVNPDMDIPDDQKTFFDWLKDGHLNKVKQIISRDQKTVNIADEEGMAPIHWACDRGNDDMVELLIQHGADLNVQDPEGQTPLHYAACCEHLEVVKMLLDSGSDCNICDINGCLPECESQEITDMFNKYR